MYGSQQSVLQRWQLQLLFFHRKSERQRRHPFAIQLRLRLQVCTSDACHVLSGQLLLCHKLLYPVTSHALDNRKILWLWLPYETNPQLLKCKLHM
jgi:hypothetical protein